MNRLVSEQNNLTIRPIQYKDLPAIEKLLNQSQELHHSGSAFTLNQALQQFRQWYSGIKLLNLLPTQNQFCLYVAEQQQQVVGAIKVSPTNRTRSTWQVEQIVVDSDYPVAGKRIGSQLLRYCFETIWEARTWILEVNIHNKNILALYRRNGFQPLAQFTYWAIAPEKLQELAQQEPKLPNLLPINNADAQLLYQLDTVSMPPLLRQVFDRHINDFKRNLWENLVHQLRQWLSQTLTKQGYVFEPQRKAAIGYFHLQPYQGQSEFYQAKLTVHPAYTWLYPELLAQMAQVIPKTQNPRLLLASADYQPEREEYLEQIGAERMEHTLLLSRSVWHKLREAPSTSLERLQLSGVLQGLNPGRTPIPNRSPWLNSLSDPLDSDQAENHRQPEIEQGEQE